MGGIGGALIGSVVLLFIGNPARWKWVLVCIAVGALTGWLWPMWESIVIRLRIEDWRLEQIEIQGVRFTSAGMQRRVAWRLFVEIATRIATQPVQDDSGDDGIALKSLYDLFQITRKAISEMDPTPTSSGETIETYALDMLNTDLRPFLSKWHPQWTRFEQNSNGVLDWTMHHQFREELGGLQIRIEKRARGLAELAGVKNVNRFFGSAEKQANQGSP